MTAPLLLACNSAESTMSDGSSSNRQPLRYIARVSCRACKQEKGSVLMQPLYHVCACNAALPHPLSQAHHQRCFECENASECCSCRQAYAGTKANSERITCQAGGGMVVTPGSRGHGPKSYLLQKECAESGATNTKHSRVCFKESSKCSSPIKGLTS